jgi:hypothetical protein
VATDDHPAIGEERRCLGASTNGATSVPSSPSTRRVDLVDHE